MWYFDSWMCLALLRDAKIWTGTWHHQLHQHKAINSCTQCLQPKCSFTENSETHQVWVKIIVEMEAADFSLSRDLVPNCTSWRAWSALGRAARHPPASWGIAIFLLFLKKKKKKSWYRLFPCRSTHPSSSPRAELNALPVAPQRQLFWAWKRTCCGEIYSLGEGEEFGDNTSRGYKQWTPSGLTHMEQMPLHNKKMHKTH